MEKAKKATDDKKREAANAKRREQRAVKKATTAEQAGPNPSETPGPSENFRTMPREESSKPEAIDAPTTKLVCQVPVSDGICGSIYFSEDRMTGHLRAMHSIGTDHAKKWTGRTAVRSGLSG